jgi:hypothetical protein
MEGTKALKADTTLDQLNPRRQLSRDLPPYLQTMGENDKEANRRLIKSMNKRIAYLKNPRTVPPEINTKLGILAKDSSFKVTPGELLFTNYEEGGLYEATLTVTNVSGILRRLQVLPPATESFGVASVKYPGKDGYVAPGMSIQVIVTFSPSSLADFTDDLVLRTEQLNISVPLIGSRDPPVLTLQDQLDCGSAWVGDRADMTFRCVNVGGDAGFKFFHQDEEQDTISGEDFLVSGAFTIYPLEFYLHRGSAVDIYISFQPSTEGEALENLILACDNRTSKRYFLKGKGAVVSVVASRIDEILLKYEEVPLRSVFFPDVQPGTSKVRRLELLNRSSMDIPYHWSLHSASDSSVAFDFLPTHFSIQPLKGVFGAGKAQTFTVTFQPDNPVPCEQLADLFIEDIPLSAFTDIPDTLKNSALLVGGAVDLLASNGHYPSIPYLNFGLFGQGACCTVEVTPPFFKFKDRLQLGKVYSASFSVKNCSLDSAQVSIALMTERSSREIAVSLSQSSATLKQAQQLTVNVEVCVRSLKKSVAVLMVSVVNAAPSYFSLEAQGVGPRVSIMDSDVNFGLVRRGTTVTKELRVVNSSDIQAEVEVNQVAPSDCSLVLTPKAATIEPKASATFTVTLHADIDSYPASHRSQQRRPANEAENQPSQCTVETLDQLLEITTKNSPPQFIRVFAEVQKPEVYLSMLDFDFGEVGAGVEARLSKLSLVNYSNLSAEFKWREVDEDMFSIVCSPSSGVVPPRSSIKVVVTMNSGKGGDLDHLLLCEIQDSAVPLGIELKAKVKGLDIAYLESEPTITSSSASHPSLKTKLPPSLYNPSDRASFVSSIASVGTESHLKAIDFGAINIGSSKSFSFVVKNSSALGTYYDFSFENFEPLAYEDEVHESSPAKAQLHSPCGSNSSQSRHIAFTASAKQSRNHAHRPADEKIPRLLTDAHEQVNKFSSKSGEAFTSTRKVDKQKRFFLLNNKGLALVCKPRKGFLPAFSELGVTVTVYNDICGKFEDVLVSNVKGLRPIRIPTRVKVKGSPVVIAENQIGLDYKPEPPVLALGSVPVRSARVTKRLKLYNSGPKDIMLSWKVFNYRELAKRSDDVFEVKLEATAMAAYASEDKDADLIEVAFSVREPAESWDPFTISPADQVIKGRAFATFEVSFACAEEGRHSAVILAKPRLYRPPKAVKKHSQHSSEIFDEEDSSFVKPPSSLNEPPPEDDEDEQSMGEIGVVVSATTIVPSLYIDKLHRVDDSNVLSVEAWSIPGPSGIKDMSFSNVSDANLTFEVAVTDGPFVIAKVRSSASLYLQDYEGGSIADVVERTKVKKQASSAASAVQKHTLAPEDNLQVFIKLLKPNPADLDAWPMLPHCTLQGNLDLKFINGQVQKVRLEGHLYRPHLILHSLQVDELRALTEQDFGRVSVAELSKLTLYLSNLTQVSAAWRLTYLKYKPKAVTSRLVTSKDRENASATDDPEVFIFSVSEGAVMGRTIPHSWIPSGPALPRAVCVEEEKQASPVSIIFKVRSP